LNKTIFNTFKILRTVPVFIKNKNIYYKKTNFYAKAGETYYSNLVFENNNVYLNIGGNPEEYLPIIHPDTLNITVITPTKKKNETKP